MPEKLIVTAGPHDRRNTPVMVAVPGLTGPVSLQGPAGRLPAQVLDCCGESQLAFILPELACGQTAELRLVAGETATPGVQLAETGADRLAVTVGGQPFTTYNFGRQFAKPNFYPVLVDGAKVTRDFPLGEGPEGESKDHKHHISLYVAHGDLNGVDIWSEEKDFGRTWHQRFAGIVSGPVVGGFESENDWVTAAGQKVLGECRTVAFWAQPDAGRLMDITVKFTATEGDVRFGDTKEGGIISVRLATSMDGKHGGLIRNSYGGVTEDETWGKRAEWVDYSGPVGDRTFGVTIYDHPDSFRYPTWWHVRDYGLFTANPFAWHDYYRDKTVDGSHLLPAGQTLTFRYRLYFHPGDTCQADVATRYHDFINPPQVAVE